MKDKLKILLVLDCFYPNVDGPINVIVNIARVLNQKGLAQVELLVPDYPKTRIEINGVKIHRSPSIRVVEGYRSALPFLTRKVKKIIKNGNYDLINCHSAFPLGRYSAFVAKKCGIPTVMTFHTKYKDDFERILKVKCLVNFMLNFIMKSIKVSDYVTTVSNGAADVLREYGYKGQVITVLRNGTDFNKLFVSEEEKQQIKEQYKIESKFLFLFVGRIVPNKNIDFSLKVLKEIKESGSTDFKFVIVGSGPYKKNLLKQVKEYNIEENVVFLGRINNRQKLAKIYAVCDLFLFPSDFDTSGIVAVEAAANGLASVTLKDTCASELIINGENGLSLPNDISVWKEELIKVMDGGLSKQLGECAKDTVYKSWEECALNYYDYYVKTLNKIKE